MDSISFWCKTAIRVDPLYFCPNQYRQVNGSKCMSKEKAEIGKEQRRKRGRGETWSGRVKNMRVRDESTEEERARPTACHHLGPSLMPKDVAFT